MMPRDARQRKLKAGRLNLNSWENTATLSKLYSIFLDTLIRVEYISRVPMSHFAWGQAIKEMEKTTQGEFHTKKVPWNQRSKHLDWILLGACFQSLEKRNLETKKVVYTQFAITGCYILKQVILKNEYWSILQLFKHILVLPWWSQKWSVSAP